MIKINLETINLLFDSAIEMGCRAYKNENLCNHISFKVGGPCPLLIEPKDEKQLTEILKSIKETETPYIILGNGTNVLVLDEGLNKVVVKIGDEMTRLSLEDEDVICCSAGTKVVTLCKFALENSLSGLEFAYGIPGTCGGAVFMNAGAYGGEMKDVVEAVSFMDTTGQQYVVSGEEMEFGYRKSALSDTDCIITAATIKLDYGDRATIIDKMNEQGTEVLL